MNAFVKMARFAETAALVMLIFAMAMIVKAWELLPDSLYAPLGLAGDHLVVIGGRTILLWIMLGMFAVYLLLSVFMRFHRIYSYPVKIRPYNRETQQVLLKSYLSLLKFELTCILAYFVCLIVYSTIRAQSLWFDAWFILLVVFLLGITTGGYYVLAHRYK
ncbi:MAG: hypothetical protein ACOYU3_02710 [Bacillota bacterium]